MRVLTYFATVATLILALFDVVPWTVFLFFFACSIGESTAENEERERWRLEGQIKMLRLRIQELERITGHTPPFPID